MSLQADLVALLDTLDGVKVLGYPGTIDGVTGPTAQVWTDNIEYLPEAPQGNYKITCTLMILTAHQDPQRAENDLSATLMAVLELLWNADKYLLTSAERTVSQDNTLHSWTLTVSGGLQITEA